MTTQIAKTNKIALIVLSLILCSFWANADMAAAQPLPHVEKQFFIENFPDSKIQKNRNFSNSSSAAFDDISLKISIDSLNLFVRQLSGDMTIFIDLIPETIKTRFAKSEDIFKATTFLKMKLENFGYQAQLQEFYLTPRFGDILFAPDNPKFGWFYLDGKIYATSDSGNSWVEQPTPFLLTDLKNFEVVDSNVVYGVGYAPILIKTIDGGKNWEKLTPPFNYSIYGASFIDENQGWICGNYGNIYHTRDGGKSWEKQELSQTYGVYAIDFLDSLRGCAVGNLGSIYRTEDGGAHWIDVSVPQKEVLLTVRYFGVDKLFAIGTGGLLLKSEDCGASWQATILDSTQILWDIDFLDHQNGITVGSNGRIFLSDDGGDTWQQKKGITSAQCYYLDIDSAGSIWITGLGVFLNSRDWLLTYEDQSAQFTNNQLFNIIAEKQGVISPDTSVIICAHYDCYAEPENRMFLAPGADDNGSGSATVLEAARILADEDFRYTTKFILFSGEELGLLGSKHYAEVAAENQENILAVINLDMVGYDGNRDGTFEIHAADVANSLEIAESIRHNASSLMLPLQPQIITENATTRSDHASFWEHEFGAILMIEDMEDFNPHYHTIQDLFVNYCEEFFFNMLP